MKKITLLLLLTLLSFGLKAQTTYQLNYDSIRVNKTAGTGGTSLYGKVYLKNVGLGLVSDSILTVLNGRIRKIPVSGITPDSTVYRTVANSLSKAQIQTALNLKANIESPTFTGTVAGITAAMVGAPSGSGTSTGTNTGDQTISTVTGLQDSITKKANRNLDNVASGAIANSKLANSTISGVALGSNLNALTLGTGLTGSSYNGSGTVTTNVDTTVIRTVANSRTLAQTQTALDTKQETLSGTGIVKSTGGTISYLTDNSSNWNTAYSYSQVGHLPLVGGTLTGSLLGTQASFTGNTNLASTGGVVGIGTASPLAGYKLEIQDALPAIFTVTSDATSSSYGGVGFKRNTKLIGNGNGLTFNGLNSSDGNAEYGYFGSIIEGNTAGSENGSLIWMPTVAGARTERMRLASSGLLTVPSIKLTAGASNGYVLKSDASGNASWQATTSAYKGTWNASTNSPTLADGTGATGDYYEVSTSGTQFSRSFTAGGRAIYNGTIWEPVGVSASVTSVNGYTGTVVLVKSDVGLGSVDNTSDANKPVSTATQTALNLKANISSLATVATSGAYSDLSGKPALGTASGYTAQANTGALTIPLRDLNGDFEAGIITASLVGNASTATALQSARTISGTSFNGSANITLNNTGITNGAGYITSSALTPYAPLASPTFTGTVGGITAAMVGAPSGSGTSSGTNTGDQTNILGNAATVTTNANLTGVVTSVGNATSIANGAISNALLANGAVANLSGTNTGDQNLSGYALTSSLGTAAFTASTAYRASSYVPTWSEVTSKPTFGTASGYAATSSNTILSVPLRDTNGDFAAGTITASLVGNASTATNVAWTGVTSKPTFASVATSGAYGDLSGTPNMALYAPLANPTFTGTVSGITSTMVGLGSVENKSSATIRGEITSGNVTTALGFTPYNATNPSSYITASALSPYAPLASPALTGSPTAPTQTAGDNSTKVATTAYVDGAAKFNKIQTLSSNTTLDGTHETVLVNTSGGAVTITLPLANDSSVWDSTNSRGKSYFIKRITAPGNDVTITPSGSDTIEGASGYTLVSPNYIGVMVQTNGTNWYITSKVN